MTQLTKTTVFACALTLLGAPTVLAQTAPVSPSAPEPPRGFVSLNAGGQLASRTVSASGTFSIYDENGTFTNSTDVKSGLVFDIGGGVAVWKQLSLGVAYSRFSRNTSGSLAASVPNPLYYDRPRSVTVPLSGMAHTEQAFHVQAIWQVLAREKYDVSVIAGPSFFRLKADSVTGVNATEVGAPYSTVSVTPTTTSASKGAIGVNAGVDFTYLLTSRIGVGVLFRYAGGSVDMPAAGGGSYSVKVGGPQAAIGLRYRF